MCQATSEARRQTFLAAALMVVGAVVFIAATAGWRAATSGYDGSGAPASRAQYGYPGMLSRTLYSPESPHGPDVM